MFGNFPALEAPGYWQTARNAGLACVIVHIPNGKVLRLLYPFTGSSFAVKCRRKGAS